MKKYKWPLMKETVTFSDRLKMIKFILTTGKFTNGEKVKLFEQKWSEWLGSKHSLFVSSGSTANFLLLAAVKEKYNLKSGDKVLVPACTWVTNVAPVIQLGFNPIFADVDLKTYSFDIEKLKQLKKKHKDIKAIFVTHLLGIDANVEEIQKVFPKALLIEDVCESHGVTDAYGNKRGSDSLGATFSFYFGHHMTTVEGGMISTNNTELYELMKMKRSHGMAREASPENYKKFTEENKHLHPSFLFMTDGYNFRNHEVPAVLGMSQLERLDEMITIRQRNFKFYTAIISKHSDKFYVPNISSSNSSFCFPFVCKDPLMYNKLLNKFNEYQIEHRPVVSGNLLKHPFLKDYKIQTTSDNVDKIHTCGIYIGNNHFVNRKDMELLSKIIDEICND